MAGTTDTSTNPISVHIDDVSLTYKSMRRSTVSTPAPGGGSDRNRTIVTKASVHALQNVSFTVREGEFMGLIGLNGSGKSSLLRVMSGLEPATSGRVLANARPTLLGVRAALIPDLSGDQNIVLGCLARGMTRAEAEAARPMVAELSGLGDALGLPMKTYSSGMGARLTFAISVATNPEILLIDEALATGDEAFVDRSKRAMNGLLERAGTVFLVAHAPHQIEQFCSRAIWLDHGRVIMDDDPHEVGVLYSRYTHALADGDEKRADVIRQDALERRPAPEPEATSVRVASRDKARRAAARRAQEREATRRTDRAEAAGTTLVDPWGAKAAPTKSFPTQIARPTEADKDTR
jgi:teichoic acid transport system ATP-binding protein